ncbi:hypothetical protein DMENIID0001_156880 [Sergentomyia squamirostris]
MPWKSNYSSYTSKYGGSRFNSSRDDVSDTKTTASSGPKFGSLASPTTYRPSYSGGTYRSVPIKKDPAPTYSRFTSKDSKEPEKPTKEPETIKKSAAIASKYGSTKDLPSSTRSYTGASTTKDLAPTTRSYVGGSTKDLSSSGRSYTGASTGNLKSSYSSTSNIAEPSKSTRYPSTKDLTTDTKGSTSKYSTVQKVEKKNEGPPVTFNTRYGSSLKVPRERSRDPSPSVASSSLSTSRYGRVGDRSRDPSPNVISKTSKYGRSREPSPVSTPSISINRVRSRDPSPVDRPAPTLLRRSRDPSPIDQIKDRFGSTSSGYTPNSYNSNKLYSRTASSSTYPKFSSSSRSVLPDTALSYMTHSEARACSVNRKLKEKTPPAKVEPEVNDVKAKSPESEEEILMVQVTMVTRATSPNPQSNSATNFLKTRRDVAKTVEKTIERPLKRPPMVDKEIQSDRLDDPTKNVRVSATRVSSSVPWSSFLDTKYSPSSGSSSRYSTSNSVSPAKSSSVSTSTKEKSEESEKKEEKVRTKRSTSSAKSDKSKSSSSEKSKTPSSSTSSSAKSSKSRSPESSKNLPPPIPGKVESPSKAGQGCLKWANKDFRKSALNMGPADQPRKSRSSSSPVDAAQSERLERSPSCSSSSSLSNADIGDVTKQNRTSSRASLLATSADELSVDRPRSRSESADGVLAKNEEAKSFLIRTLGPVALLNAKATSPSQLSSETPVWSADSVASTPERQAEILVNGTDSPKQEPSSVGENMKYKLRHIDSGERAWWLNGEGGDSGAEKRDESPKVQYKIRHIESGEKAWWMLSENSTDADKLRSLSQARSSSEAKSDIPKYKIRHIESGERAWWLGPESPKPKIKSPIKKVESESEDEEVNQAEQPLGDRGSPEGLESTRNHSPYDNVPVKPQKSAKTTFISRHTNIDELLGASPIMMAERFSAFEEISPSQVRIHDSTAQMPIIQRSGEHRDACWSPGSGQKNNTASKLYTAVPCSSSWTLRCSLVIVVSLCCDCVVCGESRVPAVFALSLRLPKLAAPISASTSREPHSLQDTSVTHGSLSRAVSPGAHFEFTSCRRQYFSLYF